MNKSQTQLEISIVCDEIKELLLSKNMKYGDSALSPIRVFSNLSEEEQLLVRIDDKLSRISRGAGLLASDEDVVNDLIGYLVLYKIAKRRNKTRESKGDLLFEGWDGTDIEPMPANSYDRILLDDYLKSYTSGDRFC